MKLEKRLNFTIGNSECVFRTLAPGDVSQTYIDALNKARAVIDNVPEDIDIEWQRNYIEETLKSPCDTICGLFVGSELIGTAGIQNLSVGSATTRAIEMAVGYTYGFIGPLGYFSFTYLQCC